MGKRTDELTEVARQEAEELVKRVGSQRLVLSAGVVALGALWPHHRDAVVLMSQEEPGVQIDLYEHTKALMTLDRLLEQAQDRHAAIGEPPPFVEFLTSLRAVSSQVWNMLDEELLMAQRRRHSGGQHRAAPDEADAARRQEVRPHTQGKKPQSGKRRGRSPGT